MIVARAVSYIARFFCTGQVASKGKCPLVFRPSGLILSPAVIALAIFLSLATLQASDRVSSEDSVSFDIYKQYKH